MGESGWVTCVSIIHLSLPLVWFRVESGLKREVQVVEGTFLYYSCTVSKLHVTSFTGKSTAVRLLFHISTSIQLGLYCLIFNDSGRTC